MAAKPRYETINPAVTGTYHAFARCVRRGFLLGKDGYTNRNYSHRKRWIHRRVRYLARYFAIELLFFGFLSNHYHLILRNLPELVDGWDDEEVMRRACKIFPWKFERMGVAKDSDPTPEQLKRLVADQELVEEMRSRLADPSWFMRQLNQHLATRANREDGCKGHFFEQRFKAERLSDTFALVICGLYIDLNEIVAGLAETPLDSQQTSVYARLKARNLRRKNKRLAFCIDGYLTPIFEREPPDSYRPAGRFGAFRASDLSLLDMSLDDYVEVIEMLVAYHKQMKAVEGQKPPLPRDAIAALLSKQGVLPNVMSDIAI